MDITLNFQPRQIVYLEHGDTRLYTEVIQVVVSRQLCWVRPLVLVTFTEDPPLVTDLRNASDLLWPINLFKPALDTEVITLVTQLFAKEPQPELDLVVNAKQQLNQFMKLVWQDYKDEG